MSNNQLMYNENVYKCSIGHAIPVHQNQLLNYLAFQTFDFERS